MDRRAAEKLALDLVNDLLRRHGPGIRRHNQIGDTALEYQDAFDNARRLYHQATAQHPIYRGYFDHYLNSLILKHCVKLVDLGDNDA